MNRDRPPAISPALTPIAPDALKRLVDDYRPWRKFRYLANELKVDPELAWSAVKQQRGLLWQAIPVRQVDGTPFGFTQSPQLGRVLYLIDRSSGDELLRTVGAGQATLPLRKRLHALFSKGEYVPSRLMARTIMGEAAESSIMEGANTTRAHAIEMLREGRAPRSPGERMIVNNYQAMQFIKQNLTRPLTLSTLLELHTILTEGTLDSARDSGRLRDETDNIRITDSRDDTVIFVPPPASTVRERLDEVLAFANSDLLNPFMHPVLAASALHFFLGYVHPFVDGNGRTARMLFYWQTLRHGYGIFEYLSISEHIRKGFARYPQAYVDTELDGGDLTYFLLYKLDIIEQCLASLSTHLKQEEEQAKTVQSLGSLTRDLHDRQSSLLVLCANKPDVRITVKSHANSNGVSLPTARADLEDLVSRKHFAKLARGKEVIYQPTPSLLRKLARAQRDKP